MHIIHCPYGYFPSISGAELYIQRISEILLKRRHKIKVFCSNAIDFQAFRSPEGKTISELERKINGVEIKRFKIEYSKFVSLINLILNSSLKKLLNNARFLKFNLIDLLKFLKNGPFIPDFFRTLLRQDVDVIHTTAIPYLNIVLALIAGKLKKIPTICTPFYHFENERYQDPVYTRILGEFNKILVCSKAERDYLIDNGVKSEKIKQIHMAVDLHKYEKAKTKWFFDKYDISGPKILFCGFKNIEKGAINILNCIKYVVSEIPDANFIFIGPSSTVFNIKKRKLGNLRKNIVNIGVLPYDSTLKRGAFAASDIYLMPSRSEAFGIAYLEAWACKKPVIGADIKASIIKDGQDGFVVPFNSSPKLLAGKIIKLIRDEKLRYELGLNGYNKIKKNKWTWEHLAIKIEDIYKEVINSSEN
ncbi:MAG: glycosyltransferase family 4 protein [Candidatus Helarchaeota archaeon]|nr:glycosyltransferase family 4 protein [Candidatus Helarchaeota archaeon]